MGGLDERLAVVVDAVVGCAPTAVRVEQVDQAIGAVGDVDPVAAGDGRVYRLPGIGGVGGGRGDACDAGTAVLISDHQRPPDGSQDQALQGELLHAPVAAVDHKQIVAAGDGDGRGLEELARLVAFAAERAQAVELVVAGIEAADLVGGGV